MLRPKTKIFISTLALAFSFLLINPAQAKTTNYLNSSSLDPVQTPIINLGNLEVKALDSEQPNSFSLNFKPGDTKTAALQISNFSNHSKDLEIYVSDAVLTPDAQFVAKSKQQTSPDLKSWVELPTANLTLPAGKSTVIPVHFNIPLPAGVGTHLGAIMVREKNTAAPSILNIEKGIRVYAHIEGPAITQSKVENFNVQTGGRFMKTSLTVKNSGTTDLKSKNKLELQNIFGEILESPTAELYLKPGESETLHFAIEKPPLGIFQTHFLTDLPNLENQIDLGFNFSFSDSILIGFFLLLFTVKFFQNLAKSSSTLRYTPSYFFNQPSVSPKKTFNPLTLKSFFTFGLIVIFSLFISQNLSSTFLRTDLLNTEINPQKPATYIAVIKWGNTLKKNLPAGYKENWRGSLIFKNSKVTVQESLNLENTDQIILTGEDTLNFNLQTGSDNDGVIVKIESTGIQAAKISYKNTTSQQEINLSLSDFLNSPLQIAENFHTMQIVATLGPEKILSSTNGEIIVDQAGSAEVTSENSPIAYPELQDLFQDLPASSELLADYILNSEYIENVSTVNSITNIDTDPLLLQALEGSADVIQEIASAVDRNFVFIPSRKVEFAAQQFSFTDQQSSAQELGTIIFVHNQATAWNSYVSVSDFVSLSGKWSIPASSVQIDPGEITLLSGSEKSEISSGQANQLDSAFEKSLLVQVRPSQDGEAVFTMKPKITVKVPPGTPPGRYKANLTISSL